MFNSWFAEYCSFKKVFTCVCVLLTSFLIFEELFNFLVTKPTTTSTEEKELEVSDLPEVVICVKPGFDHEVLKKYGYDPLAPTSSA